jgi:hypothetical protein
VSTEPSGLPASLSFESDEAAGDETEYQADKGGRKVDIGFHENALH